MPTNISATRTGLTPPTLPLGGAERAPSPTSDRTPPALQRPAGAAIPPLAGQATPQRGTVVVLPSDEERRVLDAAMARRGGQAAVARDAVVGAEAGIVKTFETAFSSLTRSISGALGGVYSTFQDALSQRDTEKQLAKNQKAAQNFQESFQQAATLDPQARALLLYGVDTAEQMDAAQAAQAWLQHREAGKKSDRINVALGVAGGLNGAAEAGVAIAHEVSSNAGKVAAGALKNAIPFVGAAGAVVSFAAGAHALKKQNAVRVELNTQQDKLTAATRQLQGEDQTSMGGALANVFQHSHARLQVKTTANHLQMAGSVLTLLGSGVALGSNVAMAMGPAGAAAAAGLATASVVLSLLSAVAMVSAAVYEAVKVRHDAGEKAAITPEQLESRFVGLEGQELEVAKAQLAGENKFYALVYLADKLQFADAGSAEFDDACKMLVQAGLPEAQVQAIITLARSEPWAVDIRSPAVNELAKALYGAPVGEVATEKTEDAQTPATARPPADAPLQAQSQPPADSFGTLQYHNVQMS
jgi:hypothetical protein